MKLDEHHKSIAIILQSIGISCSGVILAVYFFNNSAIISIAIPVAVLGAAGALVALIYYSRYPATDAESYSADSSDSANNSDKFSEGSVERGSPGWQAVNDTSFLSRRSGGPADIILSPYGQCTPTANAGYTGRRGLGIIPMCDGTDETASVWSDGLLGSPTNKDINSTPNHGGTQQ
eukprot:Tbor_TRINITY_DN6142_c3_g3::TRINITY_DN6142_c3_g3_i1::g.21874::m.21874